MPAQRPKRPVPRSRLIPREVDGSDPDDIPRAFGDVHAALGVLESRVVSRQSQLVDLDVGTNRIAHKLGRLPIGANVTPTVADATWAWALTSSDARFVVITTIGVAQPNATLEVW